jgi:hypothetical protein
MVISAYFGLDNRECLEYLYLLIVTHLLGGELSLATMVEGMLNNNSTWETVLLRKRDFAEGNHGSGPGYALATPHLSLMQTDWQEPLILHPAGEMHVSWLVLMLKAP